MSVLLKATEMFDRIRNNLLKKFERYNWLDGDTRYYAISKLKAINKFIAFTDPMLDISRVEQMYDSVSSFTDLNFERLNLFSDAITKKKRLFRKFTESPEMEYRLSILKTSDFQRQK